MAKNPRIQVDITGDADGLKKAAKEAEKAVKDIDDSVGDLGKGKGAKGIDKLGDAARGLAEERLGPLGEAAELAGVDLAAMGTSSVVAGAAVVGLGAMIAGGVQKLGDMHDEVRRFKDASGLGWDASSRLVAVMDDMKISADEGAGAMGRLAKNIDAGKLTEFGIAAVYAKDGTIDMAGTLGNVADAMNATTDPTERAAIGTALFGKSWAGLMPLLRMGSSGIRDAMADVKSYQIATAESEAQQREFELAIDDMQDAFGGLQMSMAKQAVPALTEVFKLLAKGTDAANDFKESLDESAKGDGFMAAAAQFSKGMMSWGGMVESFKRSIDGLDGEVEGVYPALGIVGKAAEGTAEALKMQAEATEVAAEELGRLEEAASAMRAASPLAADLRRKTEELASASERAAAASAEQKAKLDLLNGATMTVAQSSLAYENAQARVTEAAVTYAERQKAVTEAVNEYGADSPQAAAATRDLDQAARDYSSSAYGAADAAVANAEKLAAVEGRTLTADEKTRIYIDALRGVRDTTTDPTLKSGLDDLIGKTQAAADAAERAAAATYEQAAATSRLAAAQAGLINETPIGAYVPDARRAAGGPVSTGKTYMVGEEGPELFVPNRSGTIIPNDGLTGDGGTTTVRTAPMTGGQTIYNIEIKTGADPEAVVAAIERYRRRNGGLPW